MFKTVSVFFVFLFFLNASFAQVDRCGSDQLHQEKMEDPEYAQKFRSIQNLVFEQAKYRTPSCTDPFILPVAIHWNGNITNANMTCINDIVQDQIDILNEDFGGFNTDIVNYCNHAANCPTDYPPTSLAGGTCIQFCLATEDHPAGSGLSNGDPAYTFGTYTFTSGASLWSGYVNFFVSDVDPAGYTNLLGLAPLFGGSNPDGNGIFVTHAAFGGDNYSCTSGVLLNGNSNYGLGRTATHEAGHYFGLYHVFAGCSNGDFIADTPNQDQENYGVNTVNYSTCLSTADNSCSTQDFFFNFMDYSNDVSMYMFSSDQSDVMNTVATAGTNSSNPYKTASTVCATVPTGYSPTYPTGCPVGTPPESAFSIVGSAPYEYCPAMNEVSFTDMSTNFPSSWAWTFSGAGVSPTMSTDQNPTVNVVSSGTLTVTLTASNNGGGADLTPETMSYTVTILPESSCGNCGESFFDTGGPGSNYNNNEDITWTLCSSDPADVVEANFTSISLGSGNFEDVLLVTSGTTAATSINDAEYVLMLTNIWISTGGGGWSTTNNLITSSDTCLTFRFISNSTGTTSGWVADITCISLPTCADGIQNQDEIFVDCGGNTCPTCPTAQEGFEFLDAGGINNITGDAYGSWQICADQASETVNIDFTLIDMQPYNNGILRIYDGSVNNGNDFDYYITGTSVYVSNGSGGVIVYGSSNLTSSGQCFTLDFFNGNDGNGWRADVTTSATPLPLELISFDATLNTAVISLDWKTQSELNTAEFEIERSANGFDFYTVSTVAACGDCSAVSTYQFIDESPIKNTNYYRLKIKDRDGQFIYSDQKTVSFINHNKDWSVYPNPNTGTFHITMDKMNTYDQITIINKLGQKVFHKKISNEENVFINIDHLEAGYYQVVLSGKFISSKPIVILP